MAISLSLCNFFVMLSLSRHLLFDVRFFCIKAEEVNIKATICKGAQVSDLPTGQAGTPKAK